MGPSFRPSKTRSSQFLSICTTLIDKKRYSIVFICIPVIVIEFQHCFVFTGHILCTFFPTKNFFFFFTKNIFIVVALCFLLYIKVTQLHTHTYNSFKNVLVHYGLSQESGSSSLSCTARPCCFSILYVTAGVPQPKLPVHPSPSPLTLAPPSLFSKSVSLLLFCR